MSIHILVLRHAQSKNLNLYLCPVSELPSSFCLLVEFQEWVRLAKEILKVTYFYYTY